MSERYGECRACAGSDCIVCGGTGFNGDALAYIEGQSKSEWDKDRRPVFFSLRETSNRYFTEEERFYAPVAETLKAAMNAAVSALEEYREKQTQKGKRMSQLITTTNNAPVTLAQKFGFTDKQMDLIKRSVAKNATDDELELFFYRCQTLQLNPLMPGQIFFIKYGTGPGTIVIGIDGFRARAQATGKLSGCERGVMRNDKGVCVGAWANVYRSDWTKPAHEEVSLHEYSTGKGNWLKMPETMIKKVAEVAALRIAFPTDLGGLYISEEMDQADKAKEVNAEVVDRKPSEAQIKRLFAINRGAGLTNDELKEILIKDYGHESSKDLNMDEYNELCARLESGTLVAAKKELAAVTSDDEWDHDAHENMAEMK